MNFKLLTILLALATFVACSKPIEPTNSVSISVVSSDAEYFVTYSVFGPNSVLVESNSIESINGNLLHDFSLKSGFSTTINAQLTDEAVDRPEQIIDVEVLYNGTKADQQTFVINKSTAANFYSYSIFN